MSLGDDQIRNDRSYNLLDKWGEDANKSRDVLAAIQAAAELEAGLERAKRQKEKEEGKSVSEPEPKDEKIDQEALLKGIKSERER